MKIKPLYIALLGIAALTAGIGIPAILSKKKSKGSPTDGIIDPITGTPIPPDITLSPGQALTIANNLLEAMDRYGTKEGAIIDNLNRCKTRKDLLLVIEKFGTHPYILVGSFFGFGKEKDLVGWLKADLTKSELFAVKTQIFDKLNVPF